MCALLFISEYNQTYHTSPSCYYLLDLLCVKIYTIKGGQKNMAPLKHPKKNYLYATYNLKNAQIFKSDAEFQYGHWVKFWANTRIK